MKNGLAWKLGLLAAAWTALAALSEDIVPRRVLSSNPPHARGVSPAASETAKTKVSAAAVLNPTTAYSHGDPTDFEQLMLELLNRARSDPEAEASRYGIDLNEGLPVNQIDPTPKQPLAFNPDLIAAARLHSQWMLDADQFSHTGANGSNPGSRMQAAGYQFTGTWSYGENIAVRGTSGVPEVRGYVQNIHQDLFVDEGIDGRGHRLNILKSSYREVGVGVQEGGFDFEPGQPLNSVMATEDFAQSQASGTAFLLGVVYSDQDNDGFYSPGEGLSGITVMPDQGSHYALTSTSGGYAIPINHLRGSLQVTFNGALLPHAVTQSLALSGSNVKLDLETSNLPPPDQTPLALGIHRPSAHENLELTIQGPIGRTVTLQVSWDLKEWIDWQGIVLTASPLSIGAPVLPDSVQLFHRAVLDPAGQP